MSREILFRGKTDNEKWVYGFFNGQSILEYRNDRGIITKADKNTHAIMRPYPIDIETLGQYTGLTDKNGKKIFEGDILKCCDDKIETEFMAVVEFGNPNGTYSWGWQLKPINVDKNVINPDILLWIEMEETGAICEVIGNIHDNPELLESED